MPRRGNVVLDLNAPDPLDVVDVLPSPPPAYSKLPEGETPATGSGSDHPGAAPSNGGGTLGDGAEEDAEEADSWDEDEDSEDDTYGLLEGEEEEEDDDDYFDDEEEYGRRKGGAAKIDKELVNDQDWENAGGDLTKRYNRLRQHVGALSGEKRQIQVSSVSVNPSSSSAGAHQGGRTVPASFNYEPTVETAMPIPAQNQHNQHRRRTKATPARGANEAAASTVTGVHTSKMESSLAALSHRYAAALNLSPINLNATPAASSNYIEPSFTSNAATRKGGSERHNVIKDKSDRATHEQVLDPRTRLVLFKMLGRGLLEKVEGCVSTGKEANVYHALGRIYPDAEPPSPLVHLALKIYKTSILTFKARSKYLTGEFRFKNGYSKVKNPRKMVRLWAEKEMRNLKRLHSAGIRSPEAVEVRGNVLVMTFLGKDNMPGSDEEDRTTRDSATDDAEDSTSKTKDVTEDSWEALPRLKDAELPAEGMQELYYEALQILRKMYKICRLVHADLSEYNILYNSKNAHLYTIDVSQSVEHDHPHSFDFLRSDIGNIDEFFARRGVRTLGIKETFGLTIEDWSSPNASVDDGAQVGTVAAAAAATMNGEESVQQIQAEVERRFEAAALRAQAEAKGEDGGREMEDAEEDREERQEREREEQDRVFKQSYIPRTLNEVYDAERDVQRVLKGEKDELIYAQVAGVVAPKTARSSAKTAHFAGAEAGLADGVASSEEDSDDEESDEEDGEDGDGEEGEGEGNERKPRGKRHEDKEAKKERKQAVKEEKREKRKEKIPKGVKKAKVKKTSGKNRK